MGSRRPRMPGFGDDAGGGGRGGLSQGRGARPVPGRDGFYPQQQYQQGGGRGGGPYPNNGQGAAYQPRGAMPPAPQQQYGRPAGPAVSMHNNGAGGHGPSATIAPELRQAMNGHAPHEPAADAETGSQEGVTEQLSALSMDGASALSMGGVVVQPPIPLPSDACKFPHRPGSGRAGTRCLVKANHFLAELPDKDLHQYDVAITPETTSRVLGRAVMEELVRLHRATYLGGRLPAYDGRKSMYTAGPLPFVSKEFHVTLLDEDDGSGAERRERTFKVVIRFAARADLRRLEQYIAGSGTSGQALST